MAAINYYDVILKPVVTEKSMAGMGEKKYTFLVHPEANKTMIKEAVEKDPSKFETGEGDQKTTVTEPLEIISQAIENMKPKVEVKTRRVGGTTYPVPVEINPVRQLSLALRWMTTFAGARHGMGMPAAVAAEIVDAFQNQGNVIKKRDDVHKMAAANKAFAHYAW